MNNIYRLYSEYAAEHDRETFKGIAICIIFCRWDNKYITWRKVLRRMMQPFVHFVYNRWFKRASKTGNVSVLYVTINFILQQAGKIKLTRSLI